MLSVSHVGPIKAAEIIAAVPFKFEHVPVPARKDANGVKPVTDDPDLSSTQVFLDVQPHA